MILIVDDKTENIFSLTHLLESKGFLVDSALGGEEALKKVLKQNYALIILDVQMPLMNGFEVAESLRGFSKTKDIPIIFLSAINVDKNYITKGYASGAVDYLTKPVDPDILILKVKVFYRLYEQNLQLIQTELRLKKEIESRKQAQIELKDRVKDLHTILESLPQIAFKATSNGVITFVNNHWYKYSQAAHDFPQQYPGYIPISEKFNECIKSQTILEYEVKIKNLATGLYRFHLLRIIPVFDNNILKKWVGTFTDIEDQKQIEQKKDEFMTIASHELKTPLTSIKGYIQLLDRISETIENKKVGTFIDKTQDQVRKLESLISDLLDISRINNGKLQINKNYFNLEEVINNVIYTIEQTHTDNKINIVRVGDIFEENIYGDAIRIEQVLINFLTNAIKYSPGSDLIYVKTKLDLDCVIVEVEDFGIGISEENQNYVFNKFYRVKESALNFQGLGIGLYICSEIIQEHRGSYGVKSKLGKGTQMYFTLPLK
ncbi:hybrid sensor histidine kinase/response regulator [Sphingobacterium rhinopitheci]|uniref:hybrid sensor histidine kinase/response regulator n=1 Tax=Sphingobacterium rhinopitheci TaxID=2781960 RepID=UPI001F526564|nr:response regulator [Sphingobacterium rhinopitheci]MCI0921777.1 response regulator [Sphingobacterium rhinopitheci]